MKSEDCVDYGIGSPSPSTYLGAFGPNIVLSNLPRAKEPHLVEKSRRKGSWQVWEKYNNRLLYLSPARVPLSKIKGPIISGLEMVHHIIDVEEICSDS